MAHRRLAHPLRQRPLTAPGDQRPVREVCSRGKQSDSKRQYAGTQRQGAGVDEREQPVRPGPPRAGPRTSAIPWRSAGVGDDLATRVKTTSTPAWAWPAHSIVTPPYYDGENRDQEDAALLRLSLESCSAASITSPSNRVVVRVPRPFPPRDVADGVKLGVGLGV